MKNFSELFDEFLDDNAEKLVVEELKGYYKLTDVDDESGIRWAIDRVLKDYMVTEDYVAWRRENGKV